MDRYSIITSKLLFNTNTCPRPLVEEHGTPAWAARRGNVELVKLFLANGADPQLAGADWAKPVEWARRRGHEEVANILIGA